MFSGGSKGNPLEEKVKHISENVNFNLVYEKIYL